MHANATHLLLDSLQPLLCLPQVLIRCVKLSCRGAQVLLGGSAACCRLLQQQQCILQSSGIISLPARQCPVCILPGLLRRGTCDAWSAAGQTVGGPFQLLCSIEHAVRQQVAVPPHLVVPSARKHWTSRLSHDVSARRTHGST